MPPKIDLSSDTATRPTEGMRRAIAAAEVGDEQLGEDPTVNRLQDRVAEILGTESALFLPTGTMCNVVAVTAHTNPGEAVIADRRAHVIRFEAGGSAVGAGVLIDQIDGDRGRFTAEQLRRAMHPGTWHTPRTSLVCLEQTHNLAGGAVWPLDQYRDVASAAHELGAAVHVDGARLFNAVVASGVDAHEWAQPVDSIWIDFTKGLGAPLGAVLAGSQAFVAEARRYKHMFGGAMRQAGIAAAGCLYALDHHVERLADDHANARRLADGLERAGMTVDRPVESNMVFIDPAPVGLMVESFLDAMAAHEVRMSALFDRVRAVTHLDVSPGDVEEAIAAAEKVVAR